MHPLTRLCFLLPPLGRLCLLALPFLLGICLPSLWTPLFPHALALISLFLAKVRLLLTLTLSPLMIWCFGSVSFGLGKGGSGLRANCSLCGIKATLSFSASPVCSSFSAEVWPILQALCWSPQHQQVCPFSYWTLALSSRLCPLLHLSFYLNLSGRSGRNCLLSPPVLLSYNGSPDTCSSRETTRLMSWPDR